MKTLSTRNGFHKFRLCCFLLLVFALQACGGGGGGGSTSHTVTAMGSTGGSISPASRSVAQGGTTSFTVTPDAGYAVASVSGCSGTLSGNTYTTGAITSACTVAVSFVRNQYSVSASATTGGSINPATQFVAHGDTTSFTVTPAVGFDISSVTGCGGALAGNVYTTGTIISACTVSASFARNQYIVTAIAGGGGTINPGSQNILHGEPTSFTVTPDVGYSVSGVTGCSGILVGNTYSIAAVTSACTVTASFVINQYTINASTGSGGSIDPVSDSVAHGGTASFTVTPDSGFGVAAVSGCGGSLSGNTYITGVITGACDVSASFAPLHTVTASAGAGGSISPASQEVVEGADATVIVNPANDHRIASISGCNGSLTGNTFTTGVITGACAIAVSFEKLRLDAEALSGGVRLSWNDVGASNYNLYYSSMPNCDISNYSLCPDGDVVMNVTSPHVVSGLSNGQSYWFRLEAGATSAVYNEAGAKPHHLTADGVNAIAIAADGTRYLGGSFTQVGPVTGRGVPVNTITGLAGAFPMVNGAVYASVPDGNGGWYIGGSFTEVGAEPRSMLAHVRADGTLGDWRPAVAGSAVYALERVGNTVYVGGAFISVNGQSRSHLAAIDTVDEGNLLAWNPSVLGNVFTLAVAGDTVYVGGVIFQVNGTSRNNIAAIDVDGSLSSWNPGANGIVYTLAVNGTNIYVGGEFSTFAGASRSRLAAIDINGTLVMDWNPAVTGSGSVAVDSLVVVNDVVYVGGNFSHIHAQPRNYLAAIDVDNNLLSWAPSANGRVRALAVADDIIYAGGDFTHINNQLHTHLAAIGSDAALLDKIPGASKTVRSLGIDGEILYVGGDFSTLGGAVRERLAAISSVGELLNWNPGANDDVNSIAEAAGTVFVGGEFTEVAGQSQAHLAAIDTDGNLLSYPQANAAVNSLVVAAGTVYVGGAFTNIAGTTRNRLAAIGTDGTLSAWAPAANDEVYSLAVVADTVYVGGAFTDVDAVTRNRVAAIGTDGTLSLTWNPDMNNAVHALAVSGGLVYAGGEFTLAGGLTRNRLAAIDAAGTPTAWNPSANGIVHSLVITNEVVYAGGGFSSVGSETRNRLAAIGIDGLLADWNPGASTFVSSQVNALAVDGTTLFAGGTFVTANGALTGGFTGIPIP